MKQITVNVPENKYSFFLKLMQSLNFVKVVEPEPSLEDQLSPGQKKTWDSIKAGFEELKMIEEGKSKSRPVQELLDEL